MRTHITRRTQTRRTYTCSRCIQTHVHMTCTLYDWRAHTWIRARSQTAHLAAHALRKMSCLTMGSNGSRSARQHPLDIPGTPARRSGRSSNSPNGTLRSAASDAANPLVQPSIPFPPPLSLFLSGHIHNCKGDTTLELPVRKPHCAILIAPHRTTW